MKVGSFYLFIAKLFASIFKYYDGQYFNCGPKTLNLVWGYLIFKTEHTLADVGLSPSKGLSKNGLPLKI